MPVAAELTRRISVKENKRAEGSVSAVPIFGKKEVNGEGSSMPKIGSLATIDLSVFSLKTATVMMKEAEKVSVTPANVDLNIPQVLSLRTQGSECSSTNIQDCGGTNYRTCGMFCK